MRVGVYFTATKNSGGVYQYSLTMLDALKSIKHNQYTIFNASKDLPSKYRKYKNFRVINLVPSTQKKLFQIRDKVSYLEYKLLPGFFNLFFKLGFFKLLTPINRFINKNTINIINNEKLDVIFYPTTSNISFLTKSRSVVTIHDLHHKKTPEFKETSAGGRWEFREYSYRNIFNKASLFLAESTFGKKDIVKYYGVDPRKIFVLQMLPPSYLNPSIKKEVYFKLQKKFNIGKKYIFYPAKFWPHKNHVRIVKALKLLKSRGIKIDLVLSGSKSADFSTFDEVMNVAKKVGVFNQTKYVGYVNDNQLSALYRWAEAMIMPTFFGPSNIPLLEAWKMGTPVIYSNINGCKQQLGDAGLAVNPKRVDDIAYRIEEIINKPELKRRVVRNGTKRLNLWTEKHYKNEVNRILVKLNNMNYNNNVEND